MKNKRQLAIERGKVFEREIGKLIADIWEVIYDKDIKRTPRSGAFKPEFEGDLWFANWFVTILKEYVQECKNRDNLNLKKWIRECEADFPKWVLHFKYKGWGNFSLMPTELLLDVFKRVDDLIKETQIKEAIIVNMEKEGLFIMNANKKLKARVKHWCKEYDLLCKKLEKLEEKSVNLINKEDK